MSAVLLPNGKQQYFTSAGIPLVGGKVFTYDTGTTTPRTTWADAAQAAPNANPVILDARGEAPIFWSGAYRVVIQDALGNAIWTMDGVSDLSYGAGLRTDLASQIDGSKGAGLVGYGPAISYSVGTVGAFLGNSFGRTAAEITAGVTPTNYFRLPAIGVDVRRFGVVGDGTTDDSAAMAVAISSNQPLDLGNLTVRIVTKLTFNKTNQHVYARGGGFKFDGASTTRLLDVTATGVEFHDVDFDANQKQVKGALMYWSSNAARLKLINCRVRRVKGVHFGGTTASDSNFQYGLLISPYGVEAFEISGTVFEDIQNDNAGASGAPTPISGCGFAGGIFFLTDDWALPVTVQTIPTSGAISNSLFKDIITIMPAALSQADQQSFNDADGIRYFGDPAGATKLYVKVTDCLFYNCGKRAIKNSTSTGTMGNNLTIVATTALQYAMVTAIKVDGDDQVYTNVDVYSPSTAPIYIVIQSHDCKNLRVRSVRADRCVLLWNLAPISTATVTEDWVVDGLSCNEVSEGGIYPTSNCDRYVNVKFKNVTIEAKSGVHNLPAVRVTANTDRMEFELSDSRIVGGDVKLAGYGWTLRNIYHEINDASYTGFANNVGTLEAGLDPVTAITRDSHLENYELNYKAIPSAYLTATRPYLWLLYGKSVKIKNFKVTVPAALATTRAHGSFGGGDDMSINDFEYDGPGFIAYGITYTGPHRRMNIHGARRIGAATASQNFLQVDHGEDCELSDIYDGRDDPANGSIIIAGGTISGGHAKAYIIDGVRSMTTAANAVTDGGAKALQVDVNKF